MAGLIIEKGMTPEEKGGVISELAHLVSDKSRKSHRAFTRLFGTNAPHQVMEKVCHLNARACTQEYNEAVFRLLAQNPDDFYADACFREQHSISTMNHWNEGRILHRWERYTPLPNPHHIVPRSRGGTSHWTNLWRVDRGIHDDIHTVFQNLTPQDQVRFLLNYYKFQFQGDFSSEVYKILQRNPEPDCYGPRVITLSRFC